MSCRVVSSSRCRLWNYVVCLPVRYRVADELRWYAAVTGEIGAREAVIQSEWQPRPGTRVTMLVSIPAATGYGGCIVAHGVTRTVRARARRAWMFWVDVTRYRLERLDRALDEHTSPLDSFFVPSSALRVA